MKLQISILIYILTNLSLFATQVEIVSTKSKDYIQNKIKELNKDAKLLLKNINRCDERFLFSKDSVIIPLNFDDTFQYSLFPKKLSFLSQIPKIIFVDQEYQIFVAYYNGEMVKWGAVNSGKKSTPTPEGLYFANWRHPRKISSVDPSWILKYNVNIEYQEGIGFHQYAMPGYPASHSCIRMFEENAIWLYNWVDLWKVAPGFVILNRGTPVIVFGQGKDFNRNKLYDIYRNHKARDENFLQAIYLKYHNKILVNQQLKKSNMEKN